MPIDYSKWKDIEISDDEDDTHPNVDTPSLFRWRHQARVERMAERQKEKDELSQGFSSCQRRKAEIKQRLAEADSDKQNAEKLKLELAEIEKQEDEWRKKEEELEHKEKVLDKWNVDTIGHDGFSKTRINKIQPPAQRELTEEEREQQTRQFWDKHKELIKKFGMLSKWDASKSFLLEHPQLCCEDTANYLVIECLNLEMEEKHSLMEHVAHQTIAMQYLLELAKQLDYSPSAPQLISSFFTKIEKADKVYMDAFEDELNAFKSRICERAKVKLAEAVEEYEKEERQKRLGPGGLDPMEVFEKLPKELQDCFESRDTAALQTVLTSMPADKAREYLNKCIASGLWVPDANKQPTSENAQDGSESTSETTNESANNETGLRQRKVEKQDS